MLQWLKNKISYLMLAGLCLAAFFIWLAVFELEPGDQLKIDFFDVGQGSAVLVEAANGNQVLIDGGPSDTILAKLGSEMPLFDKKIELVILTHPDADHLSGLIEVLKHYEVSEVLETGIVDSSVEYKIWHDLIAARKIPVIFAQSGQIIKIADNLAIKILYPLGQINGQDFSKNTNASSIMGKLFYGKNTMLFTGDAEMNAEWPLLASDADLKADILQVGHHGSKNSSSEKFLAAVAPRVAVIQVGAKNRYGHPAQELLDRLKNINIFRTDLQKDIIFSCDLNSCW